MAPERKSVKEEQVHQEQEYEKHFDTEAYLKEYCHELNPYIRFALTALHSVFAIEVTTGDSLLDFGSGPNIYSMITASNRFKNIVASDFVQSNRNALCKWLRADHDCHDFTGLFKMAAALENNTNYHELVDRVRKSVQDVIPCNVHLSDPIAPDRRQFDVIVSCYVIKAACQSLEAYRTAVANVSSLLKPGGKFVLVDVLQSSFYKVGGHCFGGPFLTKESVEQALLDAQLHPVQWTIRPMTEKEKYCDATVTFMAISTKVPK